MLIPHKVKNKGKYISFHYLRGWKARKIRKVQEISPQIPICFTHYNTKLNQVKTPILNHPSPSDTKCHKSAQLAQKHSSVYAFSQKHNNYHMEIIKNEFLHKSPVPLLVSRHEKKKGNGFSTIPTLMSPPGFEPGTPRLKV